MGAGVRVYMCAMHVNIVCMRVHAYVHVCVCTCVCLPGLNAVGHEKDAAAEKLKQRPRGRLWRRWAGVEGRGRAQGRGWYLGLRRPHLH